MPRRAFAIGAAVLASVVTLAAQGAYVPQRVFDRARGTFGDFEMMAADLTHADVVFLGEQHDDPNTHRLELAVLQGLARRHADVVLAMEMFERDVQDSLDHFRTGRLSEEDFLKISRPWSNYETDYRPLVDFAASQPWTIVASNVPRFLAAAVSRGGLDVLQSRAEAEKAWFAADLQCPTDDDYFHRFAAAMGDHPAPGGSSDASARQALERFYFAQCLKDETMGESIAQAWQTASSAGRHPIVVHVNGAFHSDFGEGTAARAKRRLPDKRIVVVSILPVENLDTLAPDGTERTRADYLLYTIK